MPSPPPAEALLMTRIVWAALLVGQVAFGAVVAALLTGGTIEGDPSLYPLLFYVCVALLVGAVVLGYFARNQVYKAHWREHAVLPRGYMAGNLALLALMEMTSFAALVAVLVTERLLPTLLVAVISVLVQLINFPDGRAMRPTPPDFTKAPRQP